MAVASTVTWDNTAAKRKFAELKKIAEGRSELLMPAFEATGMSLLADLRTDFKTKSRGATGQDGVQWRHLSWITWLMRPKGSGGKVNSWDEMNARTNPDTAPIGTDTAMMEQSLTAGMPGNIFRTTALAVTVGTNHEHAQRFHEGGQADPFVMTSEMYERAKAKIVKPRRQSRGTRAKIQSAAQRGLDIREQVDPQSAERRFRRDVFGVLFGMSHKGSEPDVPARPIVPEQGHVPQSWIDKASRVFGKAYDVIIGGIFP